MFIDQTKQTTVQRWKVKFPQTCSMKSTVWAQGGRF